MPTEVEGQAVKFTESAETAIRRAVHRLESRLRSAAINDAVRQRGFPAEVTSSDVERASRNVVREFGLSGAGGVTLDPLATEYLLKERLMAGSYRAYRDRKAGVWDRLAHAYIRLGVVFTVGGVAVPALYTLYKWLSHEFEWRIGLLIATIGILLSGSGFLLKEVAPKTSFLRREALDHRTDRDVE